MSLQELLRDSAHTNRSLLLPNLGCARSSEKDYPNFFEVLLVTASSEILTQRSRAQLFPNCKAMFNFNVFIKGLGRDANTQHFDALSTATVQIQTTRRR